MNGRLLLDWPAAAAAGAAVCGGKGWNLGRLARYGFAVPAGGVVVADVHRRLMIAPALRALAADLAAVPAQRAAEPDVVARLDKLRTAIEAAELPPDVVAALREFLAANRLCDVPVAVRSSATAEDGAAASFAGIHRSFLNVRGLDAVIGGIKGCWASLWTPQALAYRRRFGLSDDQVACAVVICEMVQRRGGGPPAAAGVAFTCDPRTGLRDRVTIGAAPGLGDDLVSGKVNPEEITVGLYWGRLIVTRRAGRPDRVLSDEQALALARLAFRVHWALGDDGVLPFDVEWVFDGRRFVVVQARPATNVPRPTLRGIGRLPIIWSNGNLKDAVAGIPSVLIWSIIQAGLRNILYVGVEACGYRVPHGMETVRRFAGRAYFDLTALQWAFYDAMGVLPRDANVSLGGHQPEIPVSSDPFVGLAGQWRQFRGVKLVFKLIAFARKYETMIRRTFELAARLRETDWRRLTGAQTAERLQEVADAQARFAVPFQMGNTAAGVWHEPLLMLLKLYLPAEQAKATAARLMTGSGMVASAEHGYRLLEVAEAARGEAAAREYLDRTPPDPHGWRKLPEVSPFRRAMEAFLAEFGHRGIYEIDMANPRWSEDPTYLLEQVRSMLAAGAGGLDRRTARARRAAAEAELAKCPWWLRPLLRRVVFRARVAAAQRENGKSTLVALLWPMRIAALEVARRLMEQGRLVTPEDVFTLTWSDLLSYLHGEWDGAGAADLVADRKAVIERWRTQNPPDAFVVDAFGREAEMPKSPAAPAAPTAPAPAVDGRVLTGTAASAGRATGKARIIRHPDEGARLLAGEVLVAPSTDPGWTPLFLRASAVVMEVGGYLSHGAIVAREYGIPAVVNVPKLLEKVTDGARLVVDGDAGRVEIGD